MQKLRLQNVYDKERKEFIRDQFELRESDKTLTGKVNITSKIKDKFVSKSIPFVVYKSQADEETILSIKASNGKSFEAEIGLSVNKFTNQKNEDISYLQVVINKARFEGVSAHNVGKANGYQPEEEDDSEIPF